MLQSVQAISEPVSVGGCNRKCTLDTLPKSRVGSFGFVGALCTIWHLPFLQGITVLAVRCHPAALLVIGRQRTSMDF